MPSQIVPSRSEAQKDYVFTGGAMLNSTENLVYTFLGTSTDIYEVEVFFVNVTGSARTVNVGLDQSGAGTLIDAERWIAGESIPANSRLNLDRVFIARGADAIRGSSDAASAVNIRFRVLKINNGTL